MQPIECVKCHKVVMKKSSTVKFCSDNCRDSYHWHKREIKREQPKARQQKIFSHTHFDWRDYPVGVI